MTDTGRIDRTTTYHLGVDLGTTYTSAAVFEDGRAEIVTLGDRAPVVPSVLFLRDDGTVLSGDAASRRGLSDPTRVVREFKRRVGDPTPVMVGSSPFSTDALTAHLLRQVVGAVVERQGAAPAGIAITHPANWGPFKLDVLTQAVRMADLGDVVLLSEPEAAAVHYAQLERMEPGECVAVYDLGGGTFDAAVLRKTGSGFEILGDVEGIERLGGIDFDEAVFRHVMRWAGPALAELDPDDALVVQAVARIRQECIDAKEALSADTDVSIPVMLPNLATEVRITRAEFEAMIRPMLTQTIEALGRALRNADVTPAELRAVLLVGGSSRVPLVAQLVGAELGRPVAVDVHPKHAVALGAALSAAGAVPAEEPARSAATVGMAPTGEVQLAPSEPAPSESGPETPDDAYLEVGQLRAGSNAAAVASASTGLVAHGDRAGARSDVLSPPTSPPGTAAGTLDGGEPAGPAGGSIGPQDTKGDVYAAGLRGPVSAPSASPARSVPGWMYAMGAAALVLVLLVGAFAIRGDGDSENVPTSTSVSSAAAEGSAPAEATASGTDTRASLNQAEPLDGGEPAAETSPTTSPLAVAPTVGSTTTGPTTTGPTATGPTATGPTDVQTPDPTSTTAGSTTTTTVAQPAGFEVTIDAITISDGRYLVDYSTNYDPLISSDPGAIHIHFYFDTVSVAEAGNPGSGPWKLYDGPAPFAGYGVADRPDGATALCATAADHTHAVVDPSQFHCLELPAG